MTENNKLFLLDAYALIFRAHYAFINNPMRNSNGLNTSCIFGFVNTLEDVLSKEKPSHIAVAFDPGGPNFRHHLYPLYKANRDETPEDIKLSVPYIKEILKAYGIPILQIDGYEADDIIGTISKHAEKDGYQVYMMTPDKDYIQLLSNNVFMYKPNRAGGIDVVDMEKGLSGFKLKSPDQFIDILALMGDASDNIPGAPGVGEKTAQKLIEEYHSLDNIFENVSKLKGKLQETFKNFREQIELSKVLATIKCDVPISVTEDELVISKPDITRIRELFAELNFKTLERRVLARYTTAAPVQNSLFDIPVSNNSVVPISDSIKNVSHQYHLADTFEKRAVLISQLTALKEFCFDTETTSLNIILAQLVGISFAWKKGEAWYVPIPLNNIESQNVIDEFKYVLENQNILKIGQNLKYDISVLKNYNIRVQGEIFDTMLAHYLIQPESRHNMDILAKQYLNYDTIHIEELIGSKGSNQLNMRNVSVDKIKDYAAEDADITFQLKEKFIIEINNLNCKKLSKDIEMPLVQVLSDMERTGITINPDALKDLAIGLRTDIIAIENKIFELAGIEFNISSPKQLGEILFEKLKIDDKAKLTKTKQYSTNEEVLAQLVDKHEIVPLILEFRGLKKLLNTYVEALPELINPITGKIHTSYNQALTSTGRLSSNDPNLQNIPIRDERGREIRKAFVPSSSDHVLMSADYSQIELRIMAHISRDENMMEAFRNNEDIHSAIAAKIFNIPISEVNKDMRRKAKTANFGIIYGISAFGLSQRLSIPRKEASELIEGYFVTFSGVKTYMDRIVSDAREHGFVETFMGRRRYLPDINSGNGMTRSLAERNAINSPIQGAAADIIKLAMVNIHRAMKSRNLSSKMILQVHDELVFDVVLSEIETMKELVKYEMENCVALDVPLLVEIGYGNNWLDAH